MLAPAGGAVFNVDADLVGASFVHTELTGPQVIWSAGIRCASGMGGIGVGWAVAKALELALEGAGG